MPLAHCASVPFDCVAIPGGRQRLKQPGCPEGVQIRLDLHLSGCGGSANRFRTLLSVPARVTLLFLDLLHLAKTLSGFISPRTGGVESEELPPGGYRFLDKPQALV